MTTSFPLLNLPPKAITHVLKSMKITEFITLSFLSKRAKQSVESMNLKIQFFSVSISDSVHIITSIGDNHMRWNFSIDNLSEEQPNDPLPLPDKVDLELFEYGPYRKIWSMRGLSVKEWINHFTNIFHLPTVCSITFEKNANTFDTEEIRDTFKSVDTLSFGNSDGTDVESILKHFPTRGLYFDQGASNTLKHPQKVLIQNFDELCLTYKHVGIALTLDGLLMTNSKRVSLIGLEWTGKQVNRFIKHWMRGSNPRMEDIFIGFMPFFTVNQLDILKGIKYMELPETQLRWFKREGRKTQQVEGDVCAICLDNVCNPVDIAQDFVLKAELRTDEATFRESIVIVPCNHRFHYFCLTLWLEKEQTCPTSNPYLQTESRPRAFHITPSILPSSHPFTLIPSTIMTSSFPLLNLPLDGILHVLKSMNYGEFISLSLLSERATQAVKLMNLNHKTSSVVITNHISLYMLTDKSILEWRFTMDDTPEERTNGSLPDNMELRIFAPVLKLEWSMKGLCIKKWISHLKEVFHFSSFLCLRFMKNANLFDIEELRIMFNTYENLSISSNSESNVKSILKNFPTRRLEIMNDIFDLLEDPYPVLIQNYDQLVTRPGIYLASALKLDDLLITNSKIIDINNLDWTEKELNRFLKLWMRGSNPRMEMLCIYFFTPETLNKSNILKGIKCMEMPVEHTRRFKTSVGKVRLIEGGFDFYRKDGIKATINFSDDEFHSYMLEMYVWYPHCVG